VTFYPSKVNDRFKSPSNVGVATSANAEGTSASFVCGSFASLSLHIGEEAGLIEEVRFRTNGCGFMVSAADALCEWLSKKTLVDLQGLHDSELTQVIHGDLDITFPKDRVQCAGIIFEALRAAMAEFRRHRVEEFQGEKALICTCFGVSEETITAAISENLIPDVDEVTEITRAGSGCGSCRMLIGELIDAHAEE
jgi:NifU-like protein